MTAGTDDADGARSRDTAAATESEAPTVPDGGPQVGDGAPADTFDGAPDDQEMPLTAHIEEMIRRLGIVLIVMAGVSATTFLLPNPSNPIAVESVNWLWYSFLPGSPEACVGADPEGATACPRVYHPYPNERRYYLASVPTSLVLALVGVAFAYFLVLPLIFSYFLYYSEGVAEIAFGLQETFNLILLMMGMFAVIFQIPLFIMLAIMMGVTSRRWLEQRRLLFWGGFLGFAFIFNPDLTGMAPLIVTATMIVLFEGTLALLRWTGR